MEKKKTDPVSLIEAIDAQVPRVRTKSLDVSFNELANMYEAEELVIDPEYQRLFRWSEGKQSRFIESILLEMPIPPIFVIERRDGVYELIDGLQRISSYLHFLGKHHERQEEDGSLSFLTLTGCDIVESLNGYKWHKLPTALQIKAKRYFVRVEVLKIESDRHLQYDIFKRLKTGGENLSEQEIRNCSIRLLDDRILEFIIEMSKNPNFKVCIDTLPDEAKEKKQDQEYVLRFFAFKNYREKYVHTVGDFLTQYIEVVADPEETAVVFNYEEERKIFETTFYILKEVLGEWVFSRFGKNDNLIGPMRSNYFEAFTLGIQPKLDKIDAKNPEMIKKIREAFIELRKNGEFKKVTGGGVNYPKPLNARINLVTQALERVL